MQSYYPTPICLVLALMAASPAIAQPASDPVRQFQVRIVDVPRAEALKGLPASAFDGESHALDGQTVSRLLDSSMAVPLNSFGGSTSHEILIREDEQTIDFRLTEGEPIGKGLRIGYVAEFTENDVSKITKGSGILPPGDVLVSIEDGDDPAVTRLTVLSVN